MRGRCSKGGRPPQLESSHADEILADVAGTPDAIASDETDMDAWQRVFRLAIEAREHLKRTPDASEMRARIERLATFISQELLMRDVIAYSVARQHAAREHFDLVACLVDMVHALARAKGQAEQLAMRALQEAGPKDWSK